jgi:putative spermidine/putrescine transport system permease protein
MKHVEPLEIRLLHPLLSVYSLALLMFLIIPILIIVPLSFNEGSFLSYPLSGLSLRWYREFFNSGDWMQGLGQQPEDRPGRDGTGHGFGHAGVGRPVPG